MLNTARIELHLHLDGSLNIRWAYEKSLKRGVIPADSSFKDYYNLLFANNAQPHNVSITKFDLTCNILQTAEDLTEATYDLVRRLANQGIWYAEIRFASQQHCKEGLSQKEALYAVIHGARKGMEVFPDIRIVTVPKSTGKKTLRPFASQRKCLEKAQSDWILPDLKTTVITRNTPHYLNWPNRKVSLLPCMPEKWESANMYSMLLRWVPVGLVTV